MRHIPALDGIRAFAVLAVVAGHLGLPLARGGWLGVDVFFVLSGYLITTLLLREHDRTGRVRLRLFYVRRLLRLYPALLVLLVTGGVFAASLAPHGGSYAATAALPQRTRPTSPAWPLERVTSVLSRTPGALR